MIIAARRCLTASRSSTLTAAKLSYKRQWRSSDFERADLPHLSSPDPESSQSPPSESASLLRSRPRSLLKPYYVTTPIFYPNAVPHIGHLYSLVLADIYARHARYTMPYRPVHFITGTDEHGMKIQKAAKDRGMDPKELCDLLGHAFNNLAQQAKITHTKFVRTTAEEHHHGVKTLWNDLFRRGYIYKGRHAGWYAISDEAFYTDSQVRSQVDPKTGEDVKISIETGSVVEWTEEENYKFSLSKFKAQLRVHFTAHPDAIYPPHQRDVVMATLESRDPKALLDLSISRPSSRLTWGIRVPGDESQTIYVWLDALTSYLTGIGYPWVDPQEMSSCGWPVDLQIIGKDIVRFHALYLPAFLMALDIPLPRALLSHAHWTVNKAKMSKSVGNVVDPVAVLKEHGVDVVRWYLARVGGRLKDDVDWNKDQLLKYEGELRSLLGNLLLRMQSRKILGKLPEEFRSIPLHRGILMTHGNAAAPLSVPGTPEYDDVTEDHIFLRAKKDVDDPKTEIDYAKDYVERLARAEQFRNTTVFSGAGPADGTAAPTLKRPGEMTVAYSESPVSSRNGQEPIVSSELRDALDMLRGKVAYHMQQREVASAVQSIVDVLTFLNREFSRIAPWAPDTPARDVIHLLVWTRETMRICGILLQPFLPVSTHALLDVLHVHNKMRTYAFACIGAGRVRAGALQRRILFPNSTQRGEEQVETDHRWEENRKKKAQAKESRKAHVRHEPLSRPSRNGLYSQLFRPYGSPFRPNGELQHKSMSYTQLKKQNKLRKARWRDHRRMEKFASYDALLAHKAGKQSMREFF